MPYREVSMIEIKEALRLWRRGEFKKAIARRLGIARNTVRAYIKAARKCGLSPKGGEPTDEEITAVLVALKAAPERLHGESWERCAEQRTFIEQKLQQDLRLTKVQRLLARQGVEVPYATLHRFAVAELDFGGTAPTMPVADCAPGKELQVDTGWMTLLEPDLFGKRRRFRAWIFTSVFSRHRFVWPCFQETTESAILACEAAWEFFGGVFEVLIPDNTKAIVVKADPLAPVINHGFLEYAQARGFHVDPTRVRKPRDKGRVERAVQPTRDDCFAGEVMQTLEDAHRRARIWCQREYGMRRHSRTGRLPLEQFETEEKQHLLPAPTDTYDVPLWCDPKVARDQHAQVAKALYSLPRRFVGQILRARADRSTVRFYDSTLLVKTHPRKPPYGRSTDPSDFPSEKAAYALRDIAFLERQAAERGEAVGQFAKTLLQGPLPWTRMRRVYALLGLCKRYGDDRVNQTCTVALAAEMFDVHRLERMLKLGPTPAPSVAAAQPPSSKVLPIARYLRSPQQYALAFPSNTTSTKNTGENR
jgi:transposase